MFIAWVLHTVCVFSVTDDVLQDLVEKIKKPNVALVHQMPFTSNHSDWSTITEKVTFPPVLDQSF